MQQEIINNKKTARPLSFFIEIRTTNVGFFFFLLVLVNVKRRIRVLKTDNVYACLTQFFQVDLVDYTKPPKSC